MSMKTSFAGSDAKAQIVLLQRESRDTTVVVQEVALSQFMPIAGRLRLALILDVVVIVVVGRSVVRQ